MNLRSLLYVARHLNVKTIRFNFKYLEFRAALRLPFFLHRNTYLKAIKGSIQLPDNIHPGIVKIGFGDVGIFDKKRARTILEIKGSVTFKGAANIGHGAKLSVGESGSLIFGNNFNLTAESEIICCHRISFGSNCLVSWNTLFMDTDFHKIIKEEAQINKDMPIAVADDVWIGARCIILKGAAIPSNTVVAAGSVVSKPFDASGCIIAGSPAKVVKEGIEWKI